MSVHTDEILSDDVPILIEVLSDNLPSARKSLRRFTHTDGIL